MASIWFAWLRKQAHCDWCELSIEAGMKIVRGSFLSKKRGWVRKCIWHPQCYIAQGEAYLEENPYMPQLGGPGRQPFLSCLDRETRKQRHALLVKAHRIRKNKRLIAGLQLWWRMEELDEELKRVRVKLELCGGVPSHWPTV